MATRALAVGAAALAEPAGRDASERPRVVVTIAGAPDARATVSSQLDARLRSLPVVTSLVDVERLDVERVLWPEDPRPARVRVWLDLGAAHGIIVYVTDASGDRVMLRSVPAEAGLDHVALEQLAQIVTASVEAILDGATFGLTREDATERLGLSGPATTDDYEDPSPERVTTPNREPEPERTPALESSPESSPELGPAPRDRAGWATVTTAGHQLQPWASGGAGPRAGARGRPGGSLTECR